jgi:hypothetical protein
LRADEDKRTKAWAELESAKENVAAQLERAKAAASAAKKMAAQLEAKIAALKSAVAI